MQSLAEDVSDPVCQRAAFTFLGRCVGIWGQVEPFSAELNGNALTQSRGVPGFERFVYERLVPAAFIVLSSPQFNLKDGQMLVVSTEPTYIWDDNIQAYHLHQQVLHEISNFLQAVGKARGQEAYDFFVTVFLPAQNWPPDTATEFTTKLRDLDAKSFRKYFTEFVRSSRTPTVS